MTGGDSIAKDLRINRGDQGAHRQGHRRRANSWESCPLAEALAVAAKAGLDLVEVAANCRAACLPDHGLWKIPVPAEQKTPGCKKSQTIIQVKEIRLRPKTEEHDLQVKIKHIRKFLEQQDKVKITMMFRGREIAYADIGEKIMEDIKEAWWICALSISNRRLEGRNMIMIVAPKK